ncbi:hypothetical protein Pcinc_012692 [Petrolisthes cinctipes]|uniref:Uncharacterized protein n=1 Tax=Petrolisthes cinctipes TaxID=88211 RepID=A0AAE1G070_PETCI|nr:hypothetical protein Pcinc_012692 [Petrolisthes cinctipes]
MEQEVLTSRVDSVELESNSSSITSSSSANSDDEEEGPLLSGTGDQQASAVHALIQEWGLYVDVIGLCFDTTAANTGRCNGACILIEQKLGRDLFHLACRHHILELMLGAVFAAAASSASSGPDIKQFKSFQKQWKVLVKREFEPGLNCEEIQSLLHNDGVCPQPTVKKTIPR